MKTTSITHSPGLFLALFLFPMFSAAQDSMVYQYAILRYPLGGPTSKAQVEVDFGETALAWHEKPKMLVDSTGKAIKFKTPAHALNYMGADGWELVELYENRTNQGMLTEQGVMNFVMQKRVRKK